MPDTPTCYFDSNIFITLLEKIPSKRLVACNALHNLAVRGKLTIVASTLMLVEVNKWGSDDPKLSRDEQGKLREAQSKQILRFFRNKYIVLRTPDRPTMEYAHDLTRIHGLKPVDAIHVATAITSKVPILYTYDGDSSPGRKPKGILQFNGLISKDDAAPLRIMVPPDPDKNTLLATLPEG